MRGIRETGKQGKSDHNRLLSQLIEPPLHIAGKSLYKHEGSDLTGQGHIVALDIGRALQITEHGLAGSGHFVGHALKLLG